MDSTRFARDEDLYASVLLNLSKNCAGITSASCLDLAVTAAMHTVHSAIADFCEVWNTRGQSLLSTLPNELLIGCFDRLPHRARVTASGVSRGWRTILLDTPKFWTRICGQRYMNETLTVLRLQNMIQRSGNALIDVSWASSPVVGMRDPRLRRVVVDLLSRSMPRIRSLDILNDDVDTILTVPAPRLQSLTISNGSTMTSIPARWIDNNAPVLRSLSIGQFHFSSVLFPLHNVEVFRGVLPLHVPPSELRTLFQLFPGLKHLTLRNMHDAAQLPELAPPSLSHINISAYRGGNLDAVLANWTHYPKNTARRFILFTAGPLALHAAVAHLATAQPSATPEIAITCREMEITLSTPARYEIQLDSIHRQSRVYDGWVGLGRSPHIGAIRALHLTDTMLMPILRADLEFPGVVEMSILPGAVGAQSEIAMALARHPPALRVPRLRTLTFELGGDTRTHTVADPSAAARLPEFVATYIRHGSRKLECVTVIQPMRPAWEHICGLLADSETLYFCDRSSDERREMVPPPERQASPDVWDEATLKAVSAFLVDRGSA